MCARQSLFIYFMQKGGDCAHNILTGNLYQHEKEKNVSFAFQGIASPYPSWSCRQLRYKETRSWCERQWSKNPLIRVILTELFCIYTSFTKMGADLGSLHNLYILWLFLLLFATISHLFCWLFFICGMYSYSQSPSAKSILFKRRWHH